ncbi:MAG TPA: hypothetical protein VGC07_06635 [Granulicella sp.]
MSTALAILPQVWACAVPKKTPSAVRQRPRPVEPHLAFYRKYTEAMLRRYLRHSMEVGRTPSLLGGEMFRAKVTSYRMHSFEDQVIFVYDVEKCLSKLEGMDRLLVLRIGVQEYTHAEAAAMLQAPRQSVTYRYFRALDRLTGIFLEARLLEPQKACQEGGGRR